MQAARFSGRLFAFLQADGNRAQRASERRTAACGWGVIRDKGGLLTGDGLVRSECSVIIAGYNTERRCQTDTLILAVGKAAAGAAEAFSCTF